MIWLAEIRRAKLKFGLLAAAVGLLFFLLLFVNTLSATLLGRFVGAVENNSADLLVLDSGSQSVIAASRLTTNDVDRVAGTNGVAAAAPIAVKSMDATLADGNVSVSLWGIVPEGPGAPSRFDGSLPGPGQALVDETAVSDLGLEIGSTFEIGETEIEVVGIAEDSTYAVLPTVFVPYETWSEIFSAAYPESPIVPVNMIGVAVDGDPGEVARAIDGIDGLMALTTGEAADATPGASSIAQSFNLITGITFGIVVVVVAFFFLILTVQKLKVFALLEAVGARTRSLAAFVFNQIGFMVVLGVAVGVAMLAGAAAATREVFSISVDPLLVATLGTAVLVASLASGIFSVRRIVKQDAATIATGGKR
ncbi:MAG: FtsX-like permease family protein [Actinomycetes bacterium]|jgi:putative ABC transport system permease protein